MENLPEEIYNWIEEIPFESLAPQQKEVVLQYLSAKEYDSLHTAALEARRFFADTNEAPGRDMLTTLHNRFDEIYTPVIQKKPVWATVAAWQVAACLLLLVVGYLGYRVYAIKPAREIVQTVVKDTVYVSATQSAGEIKVYDTVYLEAPAVNERRPLKERGAYHTPPDNPPLVGELRGIIPEYPLNTLSIFDKDSAPNTPRNRSIKHDTLIKKYDFVSL